MKEELTREEVRKYAVFAADKDLKRFAAALLEEMDKPKVWDNAPEDAHTAMVVWFGEDGSTTHSQDFTRELQKTRARIMAEEIASAHISNKSDLVDIIEQTINTHIKELKGEE